MARTKVLTLSGLLIYHRNMGEDTVVISRTAYDSWLGDLAEIAELLSDDITSQRIKEMRQGDGLVV